MNERIKELRKALGLTQAEFGKKLLLTQSAIYNFEVGRTIPHNQTIALICDRFKVSEQWIKNGYGEIFIKEGDKNPVCEEILNIYSNLDERGKAYLFEIAKTLSKPELTTK